MPERLHPADIEAIARRVVELQRETPLDPSGRVDAATAAEVLGVTRDYVYRHAVELGGARLPSAGGQGRLRFDLGRLLAQGDCTAGSRPKVPEPRTGKPKHAPRRRAQTADKRPLLPVRDRSAA